MKGKPHSSNVNMICKVECQAATTSYGKYRKVGNYLLLCAPDLDMSPFSRAYLSGLNRESEGKSFLGAVSKLFILCAKYVYWYLSFGGAGAAFQTWDKYNFSSSKYPLVRQHA